MKWPWVSRSQYDAVLAAKDEVIQVLRDQHGALAQRLSAPIAVSVALPEGFAVQMPAVVGRRPKRQDQDAPRPVAQEIDWSLIDENDNEALARAVAKEGGKMLPPHLLAQTVSRMKMTIRAAKADKLRKSLVEGRVGTQLSPAAEMNDDDATAYVPLEIRKLVENAERG